MKVIRLQDCPRVTAPDFAIAQEWISPRNSAAQTQSLAKIFIPPGVEIAEHHHRECEEVYFILEGQGEMYLDGETQTLRPGDAVVILPGQRHRIKNAQTTDLIMFVTCCPAWTPEDQVF